MRRRTVALALGVWLAAAGCRGGQTLVLNGIKVREQYWYDAVYELQPRAAVELVCPAEQLGFALLKRGRQRPIAIAVAGCGRSALYLRNEFGSYHGPWVLTTLQGTSPAPPAPPQPTAAPPAPPSPAAAPAPSDAAPAPPPQPR